MDEKFELVKQYVMDMDLVITGEDTEEQLVIVQDEENGIMNLVIDCDDPIVVLEQVIMNVPADPQNLYKRLLQMNRTLVHGAFVLDEDEKRIIFRDTLQLENLDRNELEGSVQALSLGLSEHGAELLEYAG